MKQIKPERILIFELNWLGDILFSFPFIKALRHAFPSARIACAVVPRYADLFAGNPLVDKVHILSDKRGFLSFLEKIKFTGKIAREKYDMCFVLKPSRIKTLIAFFAGIRTRIGFTAKGAPLTVKVDMPRRSAHRVCQILALTEGAGISAGSDVYEYFVPEEDLKKVDKLIHNDNGVNSRIIALNPGGNWDRKRWSSENFIDLTKKIIKEFEDVEIVVTGAGNDVPLADEIIKKVGNKKCYAAAGKTDLRSLAALLKKCVLMVSADSGPIHLASAVGTTVIGIFGPTEHTITGPRGKGKNVIVRADIDCKIPCYEEKCGKDNFCMKSVTPEEVFEAVHKELK